jgi:hypothetical protein
MSQRCVKKTLVDQLFDKFLEFNTQRTKLVSMSDEKDKEYQISRIQELVDEVADDADTLIVNEICSTICSKLITCKTLGCENIVPYLSFNEKTTKCTNPYASRDAGVCLKCASFCAVCDLPVTMSENKFNACCNPKTNVNASDLVSEWDTRYYEVPKNYTHWEGILTGELFMVHFACLKSQPLNIAKPLTFPAKYSKPFISFRKNRSCYKCGIDVLSGTLGHTKHVRGFSGYYSYLVCCACIDDVDRKENSNTMRDIGDRSNTDTAQVCKTCDYMLPETMQYVCNRCSYYGRCKCCNKCDKINCWDHNDVFSLF